jgi:LacI family transcriptional regulator
MFNNYVSAYLEGEMMAVKISDVAKKAGVSSATVSRIINNLSGYSENTRKKVQQAINELGFKPNAVARGLVISKTHTIGVLMPSLSSRFSFKLLKGIEKVAHERGYSVIVCNTDRNGERTMEYLRILSEKRVDGILFISEWMEKEYGDYLMELKIPVALVATETEDFPFPSVKTDDYQASRGAVRYLIEQGHRKIGLITGRPEDKIAGYPRIRGYEDALTEAGIPSNPLSISYGDFHYNSGIESMNELLDRSPGLTAVFCTSDEMALGALSALRSYGVKVPEEISIMGYDDTQDAEMAYPTLTTVHQPIEEMGERAMDLLLSRDKNESVVFRYSICKRDSVILLKKN